MADRDSHEYPPREWSGVALARTLESTPEQYSIPTYEETSVWDEMRSNQATKPLAIEIRARAREIRGRPVPPLPASRYLEYTRNGDRIGYESVERRRRDRLSILAVAECFERDGRYLDDILDYAWAICRQATWAYPAHIDDWRATEGLPDAVPDGSDSVKLFSVATALLLAELDYVLGDRLHPALRDRIRREVDRRILQPYEDRDDHGWMRPPTANWNAVCNSGVAVSALHVTDDHDRQAKIVSRAASNMRHYVDSFDPSGAPAEGVGYWNYGFENYVKLAAALAVRTDGEYDLASPPIMEAIARFPMRVRMSPGRYVPFSDTEEDAILYAHLLGWSGERYDDPRLRAMADRSTERAAGLFEKSFNYNLPEILRDLSWALDFETDSTGYSSARRDFLEGCQWWLRRPEPDDPDGLVVAAKGGNNGEPHNHNDCGTFVVHVNGESLLTDLGREPYDRDYFGPKRHTDYLAPRSFGHSVPRANGCEQRTGEQYAADIRHRDPEGDAVEFELGACYPDSAGIESLVRRLDVRDGASLTVADEVLFASDAPRHELESVVVSYFPMTTDGGDLVITGTGGRAIVTPRLGALVEVEHLTDAIASVDDHKGYRDVYRARFEGPDVRESGVELSIETEPNG